MARFSSSLLVAILALVARACAGGESPRGFKYRTYSQIVDTLLRLQQQHPGYVEVFSAQDRYGLPLRNELLCKRNGQSEPCRHYVIKITDKASLPDPSRPEVFFSGALHGDERVGPQAVTTLAELLVDHASRPDGNPWIKRLVQTRTVVIMPTTNAHGYDNNDRGELDVDPNRDFNYLSNGTCFQSMVARAVNEVWRDHLFQLAITFHGGTESISYEWGTPNHEFPGGGSEKSPDDLAQVYAALGMSRFGGRFEKKNAYYPHGTMTDQVYGVAGGMEDWAYAASWENAVTPANKPRPQEPCRPKTFDGYPADKTMYNNATHRAFNILIETSNDKEPSERELGDSAALSDAALADFLPETQTIGHVPRNVRAALMYIDIVQPYVLWKTTPTTASVGVATKFEWEVRGAFTVDNTNLKISKTPDFSNSDTTTKQTGVTRWYHPDMKTSTATNKGLFSHDITFNEPGVYYVQATATVDQDWTKQGTGKNAPVPNVPPQTHVVNARTNPNWKMSNNGKIVNGRLEWTSPRELGDSAALSDATLADFLPETQTIGHVPRNVRAALMYIDIVQPYVLWKTTPTTASVGVATKFEWEVRGAFTVDNTNLKISKTPDFSNSETTTKQTGVTRWYHPDMKTSTATNKGLFSHDITFNEPGVYYVQATATVDQDWAKQGTGKNAPVPNVPPQTHVVNARTNPNWTMSNNGKIANGRLEWTSEVVNITVGSPPLRSSSNFKTVSPATAVGFQMLVFVVSLTE